MKYVFLMMRVLHLTCHVFILAASVTFGVLQPGTPTAYSPASVMPWLTDASISDAVEIRRSVTGGLGVFSRRSIRPGEILARVPLEACVSANTAVEDPVIGPASYQFLEDHNHSKAAEGVVVAAFLAKTISERGSDDTSGSQLHHAYIASLPWACSDSEDPLGAHPLVTGDGASQARLTSAAATAAAAHEVLREGLTAAPASLETCARATLLVGTRALPFDRFWQMHEARQGGKGRSQSGSSHSTTVNDEDGHSVTDQSPRSRRLILVPFLDLFNHPSASALAQQPDLGANFKKHSINDACVNFFFEYPEAAALTSGEEVEVDSACSARSVPDGVTMVVQAPWGMEVDAGEELWLWYGDAGFGEKSPEAFHRAATEFRTTYGFSPWE